MCKGHLQTKKRHNVLVMAPALFMFLPLYTSYRNLRQGQMQSNGPPLYILKKHQGIKVSELVMPASGLML
jgi:hypothetical protein